MNKEELEELAIEVSCVYRLRRNRRWQIAEPIFDKYAGCTPPRSYTEMEAKAKAARINDPIIEFLDAEVERLLRTASHFGFDVRGYWAKRANEPTSKTCELGFPLMHNKAINKLKEHYVKYSTD